MFLQAGLERASARQLGQPLVGGDWVLPRYSRRPHRPTPIFSERFSKGLSVSDFRKFKCTTHKFFRDFVVSHTLFVFGKRNVQS